MRGRLLDPVQREAGRGQSALLGAYDDGSPSAHILATDSGRCRAAGRAADCTGASLSDAADHHDCPVRAGRPNRCERATDGPTHAELARPSSCGRKRQWSCG